MNQHKPFSGWDDLKYTVLGLLALLFPFLFLILLGLAFL